MPSPSNRRLAPVLPPQTGDTNQAERWLDEALGGARTPPLVVAIGLGDGEILDVLEFRAPSTKVLAFEIDADHGRRQPGDVKLRRWIDQGRLTLLCDPDYAGADMAWRVFPARPDDHLLLIHPDVSRDGGQGAVRAARAFKQILFGARANAEARRRFAPGYLAGTLHNLPELVAGRDVRSLEHAYLGQPAVVIGAGPSFDDTRSELARLSDRAVLIAADTALRPLLTHGLAPQFVVAVDPQATNARHFHGLPPVNDTWLVSEASIDPSVVLPFGDRTFWFRVSDHEPWPWYNELGIEVGRLDVWGSVLTAAFQLAVFAGCDPIVIVGADLAFTGDRPYCRGTTYKFDWAHVTAQGGSIDDAWRPFLRPDDQIRVPDVNGADTSTTGFLQSFRDWLLTRARLSGRRVINASGAGILFGDGIEQGTLGDALTTTRAIAAPGTIPRRAPNSGLPRDLARHVRRARRDVRTGLSSPLFDRWTTFCGGSLNVSVVDAAMTRASRALDGTEPKRQPKTSVIPWASMSLDSGARALATALPEATRRFAAILRGDSAVPDVSAAQAGTSAERDALLLDAFELLHSICHRVRSSGDFTDQIPAGWVGRRPLGAWTGWPVEIGWAVRVFEACLGAALVLPLPIPSVDATFLSRPVIQRDSSTWATTSDVVPRRVSAAEEAGAMLALEYLVCVELAESNARGDQRDFASWWRSLADSILQATDRRGVGPLSLSLVAGSAPSRAIPLTLPHEDPSMARALTGLVYESRSGGPRPNRSNTPPVGADTPAVLVVPRVLTDNGVPRAVFPYSADRGAVCTVSRGKESVVVHEDGSIAPSLSWPRPIEGELPLGQDGAIAWGIETAQFPDGGSGYVMYRRHRHEEPRVETLPFAPQAGAWRQGRVYWACYPFGVGWWAPNEPAGFALSDRSLFGVHATDEDLVLAPRARSSAGTPERRLARTAWRWSPGREPQPIPLDELGIASTQSTRGGWTARAYPEADVVRFENGPHILTLRCYYPFGVAWAGRSLVVSTNDGELLLFEGIQATLNAFAGALG